MKKRYVFICNTEDKTKKIYYDVEQEKYGSIEKNSNTSNSLLAACSIIGYVFLRSFQKYKLPEEYHSLFFPIMICSIIIGFFISILLNKKKMKLTYLNLTKEESIDYITLGKNQLEMQKTGILFISFLLLVNTVLFFLNNEIVTFILEMLLCMFFTIFIIYMNVFGRKKIYNDLINK